jgi:hypothetical protein
MTQFDVISGSGEDTSFAGGYTLFSYLHFITAVLLHDGILHHCRLRKIPLRHSEPWSWAMAVE